MVDTDDIFHIYEEHKPKMIEFALRKKWLNVGMDETYMRSLVEEVLFFTINSKQAKAGFNDKDHIRKFIWNILRRSITIAQSTMGRKSIPELTQAERIENFKLAKEIIDRNRTLGEIAVNQKKRDSQPYVFNSK